MVEWSITTVLKTVVPRGTGGSNPSLSARAFRKKFQKAFFISVFVYFLHIHSLSMTRRLQMQNYAILFGHIKENM